jgi:hypothetical protein
MKKIPFLLIAVFATIVGLYPFAYFFVDRNFGLLQSKPDTLLADPFWNIGFYIHIALGGIALLIGWTQFISRLRTRKVTLHRGIGKVYVVTALLSSAVAIYIGFFATGGIIPSLGFILLGVTWFYTTLDAYLEIKKGRTFAHQQMMIYSYAACLAAVTLRIYLPLLTSFFGDFNTAYTIVAWLCWVPNLVVAWFIIRNIRHKAGEPASLSP